MQDAEAPLHCPLAFALSCACIGLLRCSSSRLLQCFRPRNICGANIAVKTTCSQRTPKAKPDFFILRDWDNGQSLKLNRPENAGARSPVFIVDVQPGMLHCQSVTSGSNTQHDKQRRRQACTAKKQTPMTNSDDHTVKS